MSHSKLGHREARLRQWLRGGPDRATQDLTWAWRSLRTTPWFSTLIVLVLATSFGASTAIYAVVDSVLFRPLPHHSPDRLAVVCETNEIVEGFCTTSFVNVRDWNDRSQNFASIGAARSWPFMLKTSDRIERINAIMADPHLFRVFQFVPRIGRLFSPGDEQARVAVLTTAAWTSWFGSDTTVIGSTMSLGGEPYEIIGVLPDEAGVPGLESAPVWIPIPFSYTELENRQWRGFRAFARLNDRIDIRSGQRELESIVQELTRIHPETNVGWGVRTESLHESIVGHARTTLIVFLGAIGFVLLIACTNVAHLILVRSALRTRELAVRAAIGAGPARVRRMLLFEGLLLSMAGGTMGLLIALVFMNAFVAVAPPGIPRLAEIGINPWSLAFLSVVTFLCAGAVALAPARLASRLDLTQALRQNSPRIGSGRPKRGSWVISGQIALTSTLLIGSGLFSRTFLAFASWDSGFDTRNLTTFWALASDSRYNTAYDAVQAFYEASERIEALPGIESVSTVSGGPLFGGRETERVNASDAPDREMVVRWFDAGEGYFETMGQPMLSGRPFTRSDDRSTPPVVIVNNAVASRLWPHDDPLGKQLFIPERGASLEVVGVVGNIAPLTPDTPAEYSIYWPNRQNPRWATYFVLRTGQGMDGLANSIRGVMNNVDPEMGISGFASMDELTAAELARPRFNMLLVGTFAGGAMLLAAAGVFSVISYSVTRRTREMAIRQSLGATRPSIIRQVLWEGFLPAASGIGLGAVASLAVGGLLQSLVAGVSPRDPLTLSVAVLLIAGVAASACLAPALRAATTEPTIALRGS
jgi:putative ABC transport system permease protein